MIQPVQIIKQMLEKNSFNKDLLLSVLNSFNDDVAVIPVLLLKKQKVLRTRPNEDDFFSYIHELSYPPISSARTDRASLVGKPMFYASAFTKNASKTHAYPRVVSALETITLLRSKGATGVKCMTQSVWNVNDNIHLFAFPFSEKYKRACKEIGMLKARWKTLLRESYSKESIEFFTYIGDLMAETNTSCLYDVTATCVDYILTHFNFEGVLYPSVPLEGEGLNICLKPNVVDKKLTFADAVTEIILRNGEQSTIEILGHAKMISENAFEWIITDEGKAIMLEAGMIDQDKVNNTIVIRSKELLNNNI